MATKAKTKKSVSSKKVDTTTSKEQGEKLHDQIMNTALTLEQYQAEGEKAAKKNKNGVISQSDARLLFEMAEADGLADEELETLRREWKLTKTGRKSTKKAKAPKEAKPKKPARETMPAGSWSKYYAKCKTCGGTDRKHYSGGECTKCYTERRNARLIAEGKMEDPAEKAAARLAAKEAKELAKMEAKLAKQAEKAKKKVPEKPAEAPKKPKAKAPAKKTATKKKAKA